MKYIEPQMEVISVDVEDVIRTSSTLESGGDINVNPGGSGNGNEPSGDVGNLMP